MPRLEDVADREAAPVFPIDVRVDGLRLESAANLREHWARRHRRDAEQRRLVLLHLMRHNRPRGPVVVTLTRYSRYRQLDGDNLQRAFKAVRDAVAEWARVDDGDAARITFEYAQARAPWSVRVQVAPRP